MGFTKTTEQESHHKDLEKKSLSDLVQAMQEEDAIAVAAMATVSIPLEKLIAKVVQVFQQGGRLFYIGAGTSGRLGVLDASECPPTFGTDPSQVVGVIAGGTPALTTAVENAEDSTTQGWKDLKTFDLQPKDIVIGIAASGTTPYVIHALKACQSHGIATGSICCNRNAPLSAHSDFPIEVIVGPEFVTGSSRLKAGTVQKLILNRITTISMIQIGRVQGNRMVDMQLSNKKLVNRAEQMVIEATGVSLKTAQQLLQQHPNVRQAIAAYQKR